MTARLGSLALLLAVAIVRPAGGADIDRSYYVYVCAESDDRVELVRFGPDGLARIKSIPVGSFPAETEGPHGINLSADGRHWFVSISHGMPFGSVHKYETGTDEWVGDVTVGMFPATLVVSPSTGLLYVVNFDLYGDPEPSTISVVETSTMIEVARIPTGVMPHGARLDEKGTRLYSVNMMDDELVEVDALRFAIARRLPLGEKAEGGESALPVKPTWVTAPTKQGRVYVAGNGNDTIYEVDLAAWRVRRRLGPTGAGPYNLAATPDGRTLVATYKGANAVGFVDLEAGRERARVPTTRPVPHGVVVSPDGRFAFVTVEGVGGEPGAVEVYDVAEGRRVAAVDVGKQAGGIAFWKTEP